MPAVASSPSTRMTRSTQKRPLSQTSSTSTGDLSSLPIPSAPRLPVVARAETPTENLTSKRYKAALSAESRSRTLSRTKPPNLSRPGTPKKCDGSRSTTPVPPSSPQTPRKRTQSTSSPFAGSEYLESEMDVSRVDPERALIDSQNVDVDVSGDIDEMLLKQIDHGKEDKVLVSIRVRPTNQTEAWSLNNSQGTIKLGSQFAKVAATNQEFRFDEVLTGSENRPVYNAVARGHVCAAMDGYNAVVFAYGQTASGKTFTLTGDEQQPGIIPRAMKDVFSYIRRTPSREYLLRCSYLEIYNETIHDLLCPPSSLLTHAPVNIQGTGNNVTLTPLREEVVTSLKGVKEVLERGYGNRRTASTDWNERSSRSHSVFRVVIESRERGSASGSDGRATPSVPPTPGGSRLQARGGRSVRTSVLSLIDLAGSEKATSDKDRTREGKYINTSLLTLGSVIATLGENSAKGKSDHVPYRNSKLTRMLQPSLSGNARISVICTINPELSAIAESTSTLLFAQRVKRVQLSAQKKEVVDTDALLERYRKEIEDLKRRLAEREADGPIRNRRLSAREQIDESKAMNDLNSRIRQLTKLILTSQTVGETKGDESRPASPSKLDFDLSPYELQQELLAARREMETQATQILALEASLLARPELPADAPESEKDKLIAEQTKTIRELDIVVRGYEDNLGEPLRAVREDVEREWGARLELEVKKREEKEAWAHELVRQLEKEKQMRTKLEEERLALANFVTKFDALGLNATNNLPSRLRPPTSTPTSQTRKRTYALGLAVVPEQNSPSESPVKFELSHATEQVNLLDQTPEEGWDVDAVADISFDTAVAEKPGTGTMGRHQSPMRAVLADKENVFI